MRPRILSFIQHDFAPAEELQLIFACRTLTHSKDTMPMRFAYLLSLTVALALGGCRTTPQVKEKPIGIPRMPSGTYTMEHEKRVRRYTVHLPKGKEYDNNMALVIALHGSPGNAKNLEENSLLSKKSDAAGFIVVYPDGTGVGASAYLDWNSGHCCGYGWEAKVDDVGFLRNLITYLVREYQVDRRRIYAAGFSKGAMMAERLACEASDLIRGIADVGGALNFDGCKPAHAVDILLVHGRFDWNVQFGGPLPKKMPPLAPGEDRPVSYTVDVWQKNNRCTPGKKIVLGDVERDDFKCTRGALRLYAIAKEGHTWPGGLPGMIGGEKPTQQFNVNDAMWDFWSHARARRRQNPVPKPHKKEQSKHKSAPAPVQKTEQAKHE